MSDICKWGKHLKNVIFNIICTKLCKCIIIHRGKGERGEKKEGGVGWKEVKI
jgi:hypothetical protein